MIVRNAKIFPKQNGGRPFEIVDSALLDATQGLLPCYNRESVWGKTLPTQTDSLGLIDNTSFW